MSEKETFKKRHFIILGRVSDEIAQKIIEQYGVENVIQARFGTYEDGEHNWELFVRAKYRLQQGARVHGRSRQLAFRSGKSLEQKLPPLYQYAEYRD